MSDIPEEMRREYERELDRYMFTDGVGVLDVVTWRWFMNRKRISVCNPKVFFVGQKVQIFSKSLKKPRGIRIIAKVHNRSIEFTEKLPRGTKRGDLLIIEGV